MHLGLMFLDKANSISHCTYHIAEVLCREVELTCYLAAQNEMVKQFETLPCRVRSFPMKRGYAALIVAMITGHEKSGIASAILSDSPDILVDTGSGWWRGVVERELRHQIPIAEMVHDVTPHPGLMGLIERIHRIVYPSVADVVISLSKHGYSQLLRKYPGKYHIESRLGILLQSGHPDPEIIASRNHRMLFFGRIEPYKGLDVLIDAFAIAKRHNPNLELSVIGRGKLSRGLQSKASELGVYLRNEYVSDKEASRLIAEHGVMVLPYTSATQSGVAAVALANGLPCIASSVGALPEQVLNRKTGLLVPPNDAQALAKAMLLLSQNHEMARSMSEETLKFAQEVYSWDHIAHKLLCDLKAFLHKSSYPDRSPRKKNVHPSSN